MIKNKKIIIKGAYGESNFGDDLLMVTVERFLFESANSEGLEILFVSNNANTYCNQILNHYTFADLADLSENERCCDVLIYGGGTQFFDFGEPYIKRILALCQQPKDFLSTIKKKLFYKGDVANKITAKKIVALALGVGPFVKKRKTYRILQQALLQWDVISVRDEVSRKYCQSLGVDSVILGADLCFSDYFTERFLPVVTVGKEKKNKKSIAIVVRDWEHDIEGGAYIKPLIDFVMNNSAFNFTFVLFAQGKDKNWHARLNQLNINYIAWNPTIDSLEGFFATFAEFDGFITARYHAAVLATLLNKPTICIEVEDKLRILVEQIPEIYLWEKGFSQTKLDEMMSMFEKPFNCTESVGLLKRLSNDMLDEITNHLNRMRMNE